MCERMLQPWEREVTLGGTTFTVDLRPMRSRAFLRKALALQGDDATAADQIALFDECFKPEEDQILAETVRRRGYEDYETYYAVCAELFEAVEAKNS